MRNELPTPIEQAPGSEVENLTPEQIQQLSEEMTAYARGILERIQEIYEILEHDSADEIPKEVRKALQDELVDLDEQRLLETMAEEMQEEGAEVTETRII